MQVIHRSEISIKERDYYTPGALIKRFEYSFTLVYEDGQKELRTGHASTPQIALNVALRDSGRLIERGRK